MQQMPWFQRTMMRWNDPLPSSPKCVEMAAIDIRSLDTFGGGGRSRRGLHAANGLPVFPRFMRHVLSDALLIGVFVRH
jgi:hypothetical protein